MPLRIVFFGTPAFAVPSLEALAGAGHVITSVVSQPDRPRGRGQHVQPSDVKTSALSLSVPVLQPARLKDADFSRELAGLKADLGVVAAYGRILPANLLAIPRLGMINVHASLLPRWRGAAPVHRAILAGDRETGVTIMRVVEKLDAGPMLSRVKTDIDPNETSETLEKRLASYGADLLVRTVDALVRGAVVEDTQDESEATYAPRLEKSEGALNWNQPAIVVHNRIRGLQPWPLAAALLQKRRIVLRSARPLPSEPHAVSPGTIIRVAPDGLVVATSPGAIQLLDLQLEGRPVTSVAAFINGHSVRAGERFESLTPAAP